MTKFDKEAFTARQGYVFYDGKFVARFKYKAGAAMNFVAFLVKNFEVEEYFARLEAGETPLAVVESKGYVLPHIKRWLKARGLPLTQAGFQMMIRQDIEARKAA
jgi:hypothetical protein